MPSPGRSRRERVAWLAAAGFGLALAGTLGALARARARTPAEARLVRFNVLPPENARLGPFALSPDGRQLAFVAKSSAGSSLWVRPLDSLEPRPLAGTEGADLLFWSPDSRSIGFLTGRELKTIEAAGGPARSLAELRIEGRGGTWSRDGVIVYAHLDEPLYRISESGGQPSPVTRLDTSRKERGHRFPHFLPDGRHFLFYSRGAPGGLGEGVRLGSLDSLDSQPLFAAQTSVAYAPPGYVLFARQGTLLAQAFDAASGRLSGEPLRLFEGLRHEGEEGRTGYAAFSVSQTGVIAWRAGREDANRLEWSDRNGARVATAAPPGVYDEPSLSPDGRRLAVNRTDPQTRQREVWVLDLLRGALSRLTFEPGAGSPVWSPDGSRIAYASDASGFEEIRWLSAVGSGEGGPLVGAPKGRKYPVDWSPDGRFLVYECADPGTTDDLWLLPLGEPAEPRPFLRTPFSETGAQVSPDGRWIAYTSDESGEYEVYVQPFPEGGAKVQVSVGGGEQPGWRRDGKELFYVSPQRELVAAELKPGPGFDTSAPRPLFDLPVRVGRAGFAKQYAVAPDGRFLLNALVGGGADSMTVVLDWPALLGR